jgi:hypothetical protein
MNNLSPKVKLALIAAVILVGMLIVALLGRTPIVQNNQGHITIIFNLPDQKDLAATLNQKPLKLTSLQGTYEVSAKKYTLDITKPGYKPFSSTFTVKDKGTTVVNVTMERSAPTAASSTTPPKRIPQLTDDTLGIHVVDAKYFYDQTWAFVTVQPQNEDNAGYGVAHYDDGLKDWVLTLGPGTSFNQDDVQDMPADIQQYMQDQGYLYQIETEGN